MDFSPKSLGDQKVQYFDSETDSEIQIVFVPGILNSNVWKHQIKYFSKNYRTITFERESKNYEDQKEILKSILSNRNLDNTVLVSSNFGNSLSQEFEDREDVVATVLTSLSKNCPDLSENKYSIFRLSVLNKPKIAQKIFFSEKTDYRIAKEFVNDLEIPDYKQISSFLENYGIRSSIKNSLVIHPDEDGFSSKDLSCSMKPEAKISLIQSAGSFSFYEKPEEYNKAVHDFLKKLEEFVESRKVRKTREKNYSLSEFENSGSSENSETASKESQKRTVLWE